MIFGYMEFTIKRIDKIIVLILFLFICLEGNAQVNQIYTPAKIPYKTYKYKSKIYGDWKCFKHGFYRGGFDMLTNAQSNKIVKSVLHIENHAYYFKNINLIEKCAFYDWAYAPYDLSYDNGTKLLYIYSETQLKNIYVLDPVDQYGQPVCYNDCCFFIRKNILILNYNEHLFYWTKMKDKKVGKITKK